MFRTLGLQPSFGFGDRLGCATPGHVRAMQQAGGAIVPIFAQQSIREMMRTGRTPVQVIADARMGVDQAKWHGVHGADADHLKTIEHIESTAAAGFTFFTLDPYVGRAVVLASGSTIVMDEVSCMRAAVKYGAALAHTLMLARHLESLRAEHGREYEVELSVDETPQPTTLAEHYIIAEQLLKAGVRLVSIAPRFPGDFEKGVDYRGNRAVLEQSLRNHAAIAKQLGPYKLSLHSGSDKLSIYSLFAQATEGRYHVKTAGTSYLEGVRVVAQKDATLFREIIAFSRERYPTDRATYHVSANVESEIAADDRVSVSELESAYLGVWDEVAPGEGFRNGGRQILHCTFGSVLAHPDLGRRLHRVLRDHLDHYTELLSYHFTRHLEALHSKAEAS
jgi:tagaturonate epimerase